MNEVHPTEGVARAEVVCRELLMNAAANYSSLTKSWIQETNSPNQHRTFTWQVQADGFWIGAKLDWENQAVFLCACVGDEKDRRQQGEAMLFVLEAMMDRFPEIQAAKSERRKHIAEECEIQAMARMQIKTEKDDLLYDKMHTQKEIIADRLVEAADRRDYVEIALDHTDNLTVEASILQEKSGDMLTEMYKKRCKYIVAGSVACILLIVVIILFGVYG